MKYKTLEEFNDWVAICELKARYCRLLDAKNWSELRGLLTDDFISDTLEASGELVKGGDNFIAYVRKTLEKRSRLTSHQVHSPEIELTSPTTAAGIWALEDVVRLSFLINMNGRGHYTETYEKIDGQWYFKTSKLTRLRVDIFNGLFSIMLPLRKT
jgi:hypothetical protein